MKKRSLTTVIQNLEAKGLHNTAVKLEKILFLNAKNAFTVDEINTFVEQKIIKVEEYTDIVFALNSMGAISDDTEAVLLIPRGVEVIPSGFITNTQKALAGIVFPSTVKRIESRAFENNYALISVVLPKNLQYVNSTSFLGCRNLVRISIDSDNRFYSAQRGYLTNKTGDTLICCPPHYIESTYEFANSDCEPYLETPVLSNYFYDEEITEIAPYAFSNCHFTEISLPMLETVSPHAFENSTSLCVLDCHPIKQLGEYAFAGCSVFEGIDLCRIDRLPAFAFYKNTCLKSVYFSDTLEYIGESCFEKAGIQTVPDINAKVIEKRAFAGSELWHIKLNSIDSLGEGCFCGCEQLQEANICGTISEIPQSCFSDCTALRYVSLPDSIKRLMPFAFTYCRRLSDISLPKNLIEICDSVFDACFSLKKITIPRSCEIIADSAFGTSESNYWLFDEHNMLLSSIEVASGNNHFQSVDGILYDYAMKTILRYPPNKKDELFSLPNCVSTVAKDCFFGAIHLNDLRIPDSVENFSSTALDFSGIKNLYLGAGVTSFDWNCNLDYLENVEISPNNPIYLSKDGVVFSRDGKTLIKYPTCRKDAQYEVPFGTEVIESNAFYCVSYLRRLTLPESTTQLKPNSFVACCSLREVTIPSSVREMDSCGIGYRHINNPLDTFCINAESGSVAASYYNDYLDAVANYVPDDEDYPF